MLLDLLSSNAYLVFNIKINYDSCDLLFDALFISIDPNMTQCTNYRAKTVTM